MHTFKYMRVYTLMLADQNMNISNNFALQVEPFFFSLALYDAQNKVKISEDFHFDLNSPSLRGLLPLVPNSGVKAPHPLSQMATSATQVCTSATQVCTSATQVCISVTQVCTSATQVCTSVTQVCTSVTQVCTSVTLICMQCLSIICAELPVQSYSSFTCDVFLFFQSVFSVSCPHQNVYLVLKVDKVLQDNIATCSEPYLKGENPKVGVVSTPRWV